MSPFSELCKFRRCFRNAHVPSPTLRLFLNSTSSLPPHTQLHMPCTKLRLLLLLSSRILFRLSFCGMWESNSNFHDIPGRHKMKLGDHSRMTFPLSLLQKCLPPSYVVCSGASSSGARIICKFRELVAQLCKRTFHTRAPNYRSSLGRKGLQVIQILTSFDLHIIEFYSFNLPDIYTPILFSNLKRNSRT